MQEPGIDKATITFQPGKIWDLLTCDADLWKEDVETPGQISSSSPGMRENAASATLHVTTKFIHPVADLVTSGNVGPQSIDPFSASLGQSYDDLSLDQFFSEAMLTEFFEVPSHNDFSF